MMEGFGLRVRRAMNQVVLTAVAGGAQPLAAALDREGWADIVGTIAGDAYGAGDLLRHSPCDRC